MYYSNGNVRFENFMHMEWSEEKFLKGIVGDKRSYAFETNTTRQNFYSHSWHVSKNNTRKFS